MNIDDFQLEDKINTIKDILNGKNEIIELVDVYSTTIPESIIETSYSDAQNKILLSIKEDIKDLNLFSEESDSEDSREDSSEGLKLNDIKDYLDNWLKNKLPDIVGDIVTEKMKKMVLDSILNKK